MRIDPKALKKEPQKPKLTPMQSFTAILNGMHLSHPISDPDGILTCMFLQMDSHGVMAADGKVPFDTPEYREMRRVAVENQVVVIGRKAYEQEFGSQPVPFSLRTLVLTHQDLPGKDGVKFIHSPKEAIQYAKSLGKKKLWVLGGAETAKAMLPWSDAIYIACANAEATGKEHILYPEKEALAYYGPGMTWPETDQHSKKICFRLCEYHSRDAQGRQNDQICDGCPFAMGCNGWEFTQVCLAGKFQRGFRGAVL